MASGPEAKLWAALRKHLPDGWSATRIEQRAGGGFPDVLFTIHGLPVLVELKVTASKKVKLRPAQIAFSYWFSRQGGLSLVLASPPDRRNPIFFLIKGADIMNLAHNPVPEDHGPRLEGYESLWSALRAAAVEHYSGLLARL